MPISRTYVADRAVLEEEEGYVVLTCLPDGRSVYSVVRDPYYAPLLAVDSGASNPPPRRVLGPYPVGAHGYESAELSAQNDPSNPGIVLSDPSTWFGDPNWIAHYLEHVASEPSPTHAGRRRYPTRGEWQWFMTNAVRRGKIRDLGDVGSSNH